MRIHLIVGCLAAYEQHEMISGAIHDAQDATAARDWLTGLLLDVPPDVQELTGIAEVWVDDDIATALLETPGRRPTAESRAEWMASLKRLVTP